MRTFISLLTGLALASAVHAADDRPYAEHLTASPTGTVQISVISGSVAVSAWDKAEVDIKGELGPKVERLEVTHTDDRIAIKVVLPQIVHQGEDHGADVRLQVRIPAGAGLEVSTVSAPITVDGLHGTSRLRSVSGDIHADAPGAQEDVASVGGNVYLIGNPSVTSVKASTVSGTFVLTHGNGDLNAHTVDGKLDMAVDSAKIVNIGSVDGTVSLRGHLARAAELRGSTVDGNLSVKVTSDDGFKYDVATFAGTVRNCFSETVAKSPNGPQMRTNGTTGAGGGTVNLRSMRGGVELCDK